MRYKITPEVVLFNYLFYHPKDFLDTPKLGKIKENIFKNATSDLYIDITDNSVVGSVEYSSLFQWDKGNNIVRAEGSDLYYNEKQLKAINYGLPSDVLSAIEIACKLEKF